MSQNINIHQMTSLLSRETDDVPVILMTLTHPAIPGDGVHLSTDNTEILEYDEYENPVYGTRSRAEDGVTEKQYLFCPMTITLPSVHGEETTGATVTLTNVTRFLTEYIRGAQMADGYPKITFTIVMLSPDVPESVHIPLVCYQDLNLVSIEYDAVTVTASISISNLCGEPFPAKNFTPSYFPGLFGALRA